MQNAIETEVVAAGSVAQNGTAVITRGAAPARTGAGVYTLTLDRDIDAAECVVHVTPRTTPDIAPSVVQTSDTIKTVNMRTIAAAPAAADCEFDFVITRISGGVGR